MRTIGSDGRLQQKVNYEYLPGYYVAQKTDTTYWPNGQLRKLVHSNYDPSANFTAEMVQLFDQSGQQIGANKVIHDPWTGIYRCFEWIPGTNDYHSVACPAGEEGEGEKNEEIKQFTEEEVRHSLEAAHKAVALQIPSRQPLPKEVALVLPAHMHQGEQISGTVTENSDLYSDNPEVTVTRLTLPQVPGTTIWTPSEWVIEVAGKKPQPADQPITFVVANKTLTITVHRADDPRQSTTTTLQVNLIAGSKTANHTFRTPALCLKGGLCSVSGSFSGDSRKSFVAFGEHPAKVVAESSSAAYISVPERIPAGRSPLFISEGSTVAAFPLTIAEFVIKGNHREAKAGDKVILFPTLDGPSDLPDEAWEGGESTSANLVLARQFIPDLKFPATIEKSGGDGKTGSEIYNPGEILVVLKNLAPDRASLRASTNGMLVFHLTEESFRRGEFKYDLLVEAKASGKLDVKGYVIPLVASVKAQEFSTKLPTP